MKILFLSPNYHKRVNWGHQLFRDAIIENTHLHDGAIQYGEGCNYSGSTHVPDVFKEVGYHDVIVMENQKNMQKYTGLETLDCLKVLYLGDYLRDGRNNISAYNRLINKNGIDIAFCPVPRVLSIARQEKESGRIRNSCSLELLPYSVDTNIYKPRPKLSKCYDVMAVFGLVSYIYPKRPIVQKMISEMNVRSLIGDWKSNIRWMNYARAISQSKIFVSVNGIHNQITMKYTEAMASGSLLLTNKPEDFEKMGYIPEYHCITWETMEELREKIYFYLKNDNLREEIALKGRKFVQENYSTTVMAKKFLKRIKNETMFASYCREAN